MSIFTSDLFGFPIEIGDVVMFSNYEEGSYGTDRIHWHEAIVLDIENNMYNVGKNNRRIHLKVKSFSVEYLRNQSTQMESDTYERCKNAYNSEIVKVQSNSVMNKEYITRITRELYPEEFLWNTDFL